MKYYPSDEFLHCLQAVRRHTNGHDAPELHRLLMEQRSTAQEAAYQRGLEDGVKKEHARLMDDDWNQATLTQMRERVAAEKFYRLLIQASGLVDESPEQALMLVRRWRDIQRIRDQEFEQFMREIEQFTGETEEEP